MNPTHSGNFYFKENRKKAKLKEAGDPLTQFSTFISTLNYEELSILQPLLYSWKLLPNRVRSHWLLRGFVSQESQ